MVFPARHCHPDRSEAKWRDLLEIRVVAGEGKLLQPINQIQIRQCADVAIYIRFFISSNQHSADR